ncbi:MAG: NUDIX domain-containing protein [Candidatus Moranbacteria bacterium]|nr:NUDIX domain-containing protein [Candidatus Moranbacteria bacterium]
MIEIQYQESGQTKPNQPWLPSVHGVVLNNQGAILVHRREDHPFWALPGGKIDSGESITDCLKREMKEETSLSVSPERLLGVFSSPEYVLSRKAMVFQPLLIVFLCQPTGKEKLMITKESVSFSWMSRENIAQHETFPLVKEIAQWVWAGKKQAFFDGACFTSQNFGHQTDVS